MENGGKLEEGGKLEDIEQDLLEDIYQDLDDHMAQIPTNPPAGVAQPGDRGGSPSGGTSPDVPANGSKNSKERGGQRGVPWSEREDGGKRGEGRR